MDELIRIVIKWPNGFLFPIKIKRLNSIKDLIKLISLSLKKTNKFNLIFKGKFLDENLTIFHHGINNNDILSAQYHFSNNIDDNNFIQRWKNVQKKVEEIYTESLKISDFKFKILEGTKLCTIAYHSMKNYLENEENNEIDNNFTIIPEKTLNISIQPLPLPINLFNIEELDIPKTKFNDFNNNDITSKKIEGWNW